MPTPEEIIRKIEEEAKCPIKKKNPTLLRKAIGGIFVHLTNRILSLIFFSHFREKILWWAWGENIRVPPHFVPLSLPTKHFPKGFHSSFLSLSLSLSLFIYYFFIYNPLYQTHPWGTTKFVVKFCHLKGTSLIGRLFK